VGVGTAFQYRGMEAPAAMNAELAAFMAGQGFRSVGEMRGLALG
jgi:dihydroorotate dehydrogenase